ncbi:MAG: class I SAM-dependent methyltransferase [Chloroflexi bacterium]|nr:class I SAM-dependent methyltransferase [Chloroflexota bacterium]
MGGLIKLDPRIELVERLFAHTGPTYDHIVNLCTAGIDGCWKRRIIARLPPQPERVVDLAAGTGILTFAIARGFPDCHVVGVELRAEYLDIARARAARERVANVEFIQARAEEVQLTYPVDAVTSSYLAKYADLPRLTRAMNAMLRAGGLIVAHEFTYPHRPGLAWAWELYFYVLQRMGSRLYPQWRTIFYELPELVRRTTWVREFPQALRAEGFLDIKVESLTAGGSALVTARKAGSVAK